MFILFLSKHRELGNALDTALAAGKQSANCLLICGATDDSPLGLCDELSAWFIEPQLGCIHEGLMTCVSTVPSSISTFYGITVALPGAVLEYYNIIYVALPGARLVCNYLFDVSEM